MAELFLPSVFWSSDDSLESEDALVTVVDGMVVHITRSDGFEVRLLLYELAVLCKFVLAEAKSYDAARTSQLAIKMSRPMRGINPMSEDKIYPEPTEEQPELSILIEWAIEGTCEATDGCFPIEPDGFCEHEHPSWLLYLGLL